MGHGTLASHQSLRFGHSELDVEAELVIDERGVHDAGLAVGVLAYVGAEEDWEAFLEHFDAGLFEDVHGYVDVGDSSSAYDVAEAGDGEQGVVFVAGVVDEGEHVVDGGIGDAD